LIAVAFVAALVLTGGTGCGSTCDKCAVLGPVCPPSGCTKSCPIGAHNMASIMVDGCLVPRCCVPDDAGADAVSEGGAVDAGAD
jgi:hypothetical protein